VTEKNHILRNLPLPGKIVRAGYNAGHRAEGCRTRHAEVPEEREWGVLSGR